jgi:hypothetical protein
MLAAALVGCASAPAASAQASTTLVSTPRVQPAPLAVVERPALPAVTPRPEPPPPPSERDRLVQAETQASGGARRVLATARALIDESVVIRGTCYTWLSAVYRRAGGRFGTAFSGDRRGRYASADLLQPGDWVHFINHSYGGVTHSAIFIAWTDRASSTALTASYPGERREVPGRFREYELTSVYRIDRMRD